MTDDSESYDRRLSAAQAYFRDDMRRAVAWRDRLDRTSNWAVVVSASLLTWAFSRQDNPHFVILIAVVTVTIFTLLEAFRYRRYDIWRSRLRLIERDILAPLFREGPKPAESSWHLLAADLEEPAYKIPFHEALQRRLRRVQGPLLFLLLLAWVLKVGALSDGRSFLDRAALGLVPGWLVVGVVAVYTLSAALFVVWPIERSTMENPSEDDVSREEWQEDGRN